MIISVGKIHDKMFDPDILIYFLELIHFILHVLMISANQQQVESILCKYLGIAVTDALGESSYHHEAITVDLL